MGQSRGYSEGPPKFSVYVHRRAPLFQTVVGAQGIFVQLHIHPKALLLLHVHPKALLQLHIHRGLFTGLQSSGGSKEQTFGETS